MATTFPYDKEKERKEGKKKKNKKYARSPSFTAGLTLRCSRTKALLAEKFGR